MTKNEILAILEEQGAIQQGHFQLTSGLHSDQYCQCATLFEQPRVAAQVVAQLVPKLPSDIDTVIAPAIGGINMGYEVARALDCRFIFAERQDGEMVLRRGFALKPQERVIIVEDVVTTGGSVKEVLEIAKKNNCDIKAVAALVDRSKGKADFQVPFIPLIQLDILTYDPKECPLCLAEQPINKPGSRVGRF